MAIGYKNPKMSERKKMDNAKVTEQELMQRQSLPLEAKVVLAQQRIRQFYEAMDGACYISYSGGKDSTVLRYLVKDLYPDVPAVFVNTGLEYPEVRQLAQKNADVVLKSDMPFYKVFQQIGYPVVSKDVAHNVQYARKGSLWAIRAFDCMEADGRYSRYKETHYKKWKFLIDAPFNISDECCKLMKEGPMDRYSRKTGRAPIIGTMAGESARRKAAYIRTGCNIVDSKRPLSKPMSVWMEQDVLRFIKENGLEIPSVYGQIVPDSQVEGQQMMDLGSDLLPKLKTTGCDRTGCMFCLFGAHLDPQPNRLQRMKQTHPKQWEFCMRPVDQKGLGLREVCDYMGIKVE